MTLECRLYATFKGLLRIIAASTYSDVYKRQAYTGASLAAGTAAYTAARQTAGEAAYAGASLAETTAAVSYTHLDVYKRQGAVRLWREPKGKTYS